MKTTRYRSASYSTRNSVSYTHLDVAQFLVTLRTDEHTAHIVAAFRRYVGAAEVVADVLNLQVRTSALRTALRIEQVRVVALWTEVLLEQEAVNAQ